MRCVDPKSTPIRPGSPPLAEFDAKRNRSRCVAYPNEIPNLRLGGLFLANVRAAPCQARANESLCRYCRGADVCPQRPATPPEPDPEPNDALLALANGPAGREDFPPRIVPTLARLGQYEEKLFSTMSEIQTAPGATRDQARLDASDGLRESVAAPRALDGPRVIIVIHTAATSSLGRGNSTVFQLGSEEPLLTPRIPVNSASIAFS